IHSFKVTIFFFISTQCIKGNLRPHMHLHNSFSISLYQTVTQTENGSNLIVSPASVSFSLALLQLGARGNTRAQLEGVLGYSVKGGLHFLLHIRADRGYDITNSSHGMWLQQTCTLFVQSGVQLLDEFTQGAAAWADTNVVRANFSQPNDSWPLHSGASSGDGSGSGEAQADTLWWGQRSQVALVNTVAFRGVWQKQFMFTNTQNLPFMLSDGSTIKVPMMHQAAEVRYGHFRTASDQRYAVLELPYLGRSLSLQVVLQSDRKSPLSSLESQLTARQLASWNVGLRRTKMDIFLPRFRMESRFNLRSVLPSMGISDAFDPTLLKVNVKKPLLLQVSLILKTAERGCFILAAMVLLKRSRAPVFKADQPFLFLLRQLNTGTRFYTKTLFMEILTKRPFSNEHSL
uniref:Serpin peptidase inhibitor, clade E (nexin, plasminogen activator inhibitor type 1), member 3 n=1 Tax=Oryzias melastigma TaxID=30732 RepID=A0A3B3CBP3_ORYME